MLTMVPMSLEELTLSPAILAAQVENKGHYFKYIDTNLHLYQVCDKDKNTYHKKSNDIMNYKFNPENDLVIKKWTSDISKSIRDSDLLMINVFSFLSHFCALYFIELCRNINPTAQILVGGIGAQKEFYNNANKEIMNLLAEKFDNTSSINFGELLFNNNYITDWQKDSGSDILDQYLVNLYPEKTGDTFNIENLSNKKEFDFSVYNIEEYEWKKHKSLPILSSYGCVRKCSFCDVLIYFPKYKFIDNDILINNIIDIIDETNISKFIFMDSLINGGLKIFEELLTKLANKKKSGEIPETFTWSSTYICRPPSIQLSRIHKLLKPAGADNLVIGVETGSDRIRYEMNKKHTNEDLLNELSAFSNEGVKANLLFFPAWPTETIEDFSETLNLYKNLEKYGHDGTIDGINLGSGGFALIDGTPIDKNKQEIGLEAGPTEFLWRCEQNLDLTYWETLRRRILASETAMYYGLPLTDEANYRRTIINNLETNIDIILNYVGNLLFDPMDVEKYLSTLHDVYQVSIDVVNSDQYTSSVQINTDSETFYFNCEPGITPINFSFTKPFGCDFQLDIQIKFDSRNECIWSNHPNGEYYSENGIYLDNIFINEKNITLDGFEQLSKQNFCNSAKLPLDFYEIVNKRCIPINSTITWNFPKNKGVFKFLWELINPELAKELEYVNINLKNAFEKFKL